MLRCRPAPSLRCSPAPRGGGHGGTPHGTGPRAAAKGSNGGWAGGGVSSRAAPLAAQPRKVPRRREQVHRARSLRQLQACAAPQPAGAPSSGMCGAHLGRPAESGVPRVPALVLRAGRLAQMRLSAQTRAGSPMKRIACTICATYHQQRKSWALGPYCPTILKGANHLQRYRRPSRMALHSCRIRATRQGAQERTDLSPAAHRPSLRAQTSAPPICGTGP